MVSACSRYCHTRRLIRQTMSSLTFSAPPPVLSLCAAALQSLRCFALLLAVLYCAVCAYQQEKTCQPTLALPRRPLPCLAQHAISLPPSHTAQSLPESPSAEPSLLLPQTTERTGHETLARLPLVCSAPASGALRVPVCQSRSASLHHPRTQTSIPSIHITIHRPGPTIRHTRTILDASMRLSHRRP